MPIKFNTCFKDSAGEFKTCFKDNNGLLHYETWSGQILKVGKILSNTKDGWNSQPNLIAEKNTLYVYSDYRTVTEDGQEKVVPGVKVGDGTSYLIDMPFMDAGMSDHIMNTIIHITQDEREFWNDKVSVYISPTDEENIVFTTERIQL